MKNESKMKKFGFTRKNPRRFPGFTVVVVVTLFVKLRDDFLYFVSECVSFPRKINNPFWGLTVFLQKKSDIFHWT